MNSNKLLKKLVNEMYEAEQQEEEVSKNLAKEDALTLIAEFVKDIKKKFSKQADRTEILDAAKKTLDFFINEIDKEDVMEVPEPDIIAIHHDDDSNVDDDDSDIDKPGDVDF